MGGCGVRLGRSSPIYRTIYKNLPFVSRRFTDLVSGRRKKEQRRNRDEDHWPLIIELESFAVCTTSSSHLLAGRFNSNLACNDYSFQEYAMKNPLLYVCICKPDSATTLLYRILSCILSRHSIRPIPLQQRSSLGVHLTDQGILPRLVPFLSNI